MSVALTAELAARGEVVGPLAAPLHEALGASPAAVRGRIRAIVSLGTEGIDARIFAQLPTLGLVCCLGSGYDGIDIAAASERGVVVTHSLGANAASVADIALALTIECVREIPRRRNYLMAGEWNGLRGARPEARRGITGRNLGIYGLGAVGHKIARRAVAFEMNVAYHGRHRQAEVDWPYFDTLLGLARWADVLVIAARADSTNRHAVDRAMLEALGPDGYLVNVGRGSLVDETALIDALERGSIGGAGLDVFEHEPDVPAALRALPNVALTPHIGGITQEARNAMERMVLANLDAFLAGRPVPNPVRPRASIAAAAYEPRGRRGM
jgi:lactate dehydrogenase-like 2-hydroxyacid dehydrogenase